MPQLRSTIPTKAEYDALPEAVKGFYVEKDGKFLLDADFEDVSGLKSALDKERTGRSTLEKTLKELRTQLGDADPAKARDALAKLQEMEDQNLISQGKVEELLKSRTERLVQDYEGKLKGTTEKLTATERRLAELVIDNELRKVAVVKKVQETAVEDFLERGRKVYRMVDGKAVPMRGDDVIFGKKPNEPMSMDEWADTLAPVAPHLFHGSSGGGATNHGGAPGGKARFTVTREEARNSAVVRERREAAQKAGTDLVYLDE